MDSPERIISYSKREVEDSLDGERDVAVDNAEWEGSGKRKHKFSKSKRSSAAEDVDGWDSSGRRKSSGERNESRRQSGGSSRGDFDEGDNDVKKDSSSKQAKKRQESSALEKLSNWYQDGDLENRHDGGDKSGHRSHSRGDDNEKNPLRKATKFSEREGSHRRSKSKDERARDGEDEKALERDTYHSERRETSREKSHSLSEAVKSKRRWDESVASTKTVDSSILAKSEAKSVSVSDSKHESTCEKTTSSKLDSGEGKDRVLEPTSDKAKSYSREERRIDSDKSLIRSRSDAVEEDNKASPVTCEDRVGRDKSERHREVKSSGREAVDSRDSRDRSSNLEEDANPWVREKGATEILPHRSKSPDRSGRLRPDLENSEMEYDRGSSLKRKDVEKDSSRDDRVKGRENSWSDRNREREGSRESWKRRQTANDRDVDSIHDRDRERDLPRRGRDRMDTDRALGRVGNRKDGRSEAVKASSNFGISTENYDVIEIQPKPLDYGRDDPNFARKTEAVPLHDPKVTTHDEWTLPKDDVPKTEGHITSGDNSSAKNVDESTSMQDHNSWMDDVDGKAGRPRGQQGSLSARPGGQSSSGGSQPLNTGQESSNFGRLVQQGPKGSRLGRGGRVRPPGRDNQQVSIPVPMLGSPFGHLGVPPPGPMQSMNPVLSPGPGPPVPPGVFVSPFSSPVVWPGSRAYDMSMLPVSPGMSPLPPGPTGQRFPPNMGAPPSPALYFNQPGQLRGMLPNTSGPGFNAIVPMGRGNQNEKISGGWVPPKSGGPAGKAPSRGEQNDYSQNFVDTGKRPQNFIRELELTNVEDYPKLRELIQKKDEIVKKASTPPMYFKADLREFVLSPDSFGTKFDVILVDPPWEEYVHRAPGVTHESWTFEEIMNLKIEAIADTPSFIFLWVGDGVGLEQGRQCLKKWGFRRCEDICWVKTNKESATPGLRHDSNTLFQHSKEHCLMGIKGTVRRSTDGHIIHANIDTDVIIAEEPDYGSTAKPYEMYRIIEHFALGRRRLELFGVDHNIREGWLTVGKDLSYSNFNIETFVRSFADKDGKVWQGGGGRNPPPEAPHLVQTTPDIEALRPKSPMKNQQQLQQQSNSISLTTANSSNRRPAGNAPQNASGFNLNQEGSSLNHMGAPWPPPMEGFKGPNENMFDIYGYNMHPVPPSGEFLDFETQRMMGMM